MKASQVYAQVLVESAQSGLDQVIGDLKRFEKCLNESALLVKVFDSPTISDEEKFAIVKTLVSELAKQAAFNPMAERFLQILAKRSRMNILSAIFNSIEVIQVEKAGGLIGELVSATPLENSVTDAVTQALSKKLNKNVKLNSRVDSQLIAGMRVTLGGVTYDGSIKNKLEKLSATFSS
jgi:F-type H+-transporting ATPase subunit delta